MHTHKLYTEKGTNGVIFRGTAMTRASTQGKQNRKQKTDQHTLTQQYIETAMNY